MKEAFERVLRRDRTITAAGLMALCALAWAYVLTGAGFGMTLGDMISLSLFPHRAATSPMAGMDMPGMSMAPPVAWTPRLWLLMTAMWTVMMVAMMVPSATPTILLYGRVRAQAQARGRSVGLAPSGVFAGGYLLVWLGFSVLAATVQWALQASGLLSTEAMKSQSRWLSVAVLMGAGAWQFSPLKNLCLTQCRSPAQFLARHWRAGTIGSLRLGVLHGAYCVGCCWVLMGLLFVAGVMNLIWITALALLIMAEKLLPWGAWVGRAAGALLMVWGAATILL